VTNAQNTLYATKRLIGRKFEDPEVKKDMWVLLYYYDCYIFYFFLACWCKVFGIPLIM
jgi:hypothetical protein